MFGIVFDVNKLVAEIQAHCILENSQGDEINYLREQLEKKDERILQLQNTIFKHVGIIHDDTKPLGYKPVTVSAARTWKDQKGLLEKKFRPPELVEREERFKKIAEESAKELTEDASGEVGSTV